MSVFSEARMPLLKADVVAGCEQVRDGQQNDLDKFNANNLHKLVSTVFNDLDESKLTSSGEAVCRSTALLKSSSRMGTMPSSLNNGARQARNLSKSLNDLQSPASSAS